MATQQQLDKTYMQMAESMASLSYGIRAKVGAIAVTEQGVVITGVNGLPKALGNELENWVTHKGVTRDLILETKPTVIHAETALLVKCAREGVSMIGSTVYTTLSCCEHCASMLVSAGVKRVVYKDEYRCKKGIEVLEKCGVIVEKFIDN